MELGVGLFVAWVVDLIDEETFVAPELLEVEVGVGVAVESAETVAPEERGTVASEA